MDEETARAPLSLGLGLARDLGAMVEAVAAIPDDASRRRFERAVGDPTGLIARGLLVPTEHLSSALRPAP